MLNQFNNKKWLLTSINESTHECKKVDTYAQGSSYYVKPRSKVIKAFINQFVKSINPELSVRKYYPPSDECQNDSDWVIDFEEAILNQIHNLPYFGDYQHEDEEKDPHLGSFFFSLMRPLSHILGSVVIDSNVKSKKSELHLIASTVPKKGYGEILFHIALMIAAMHGCHYVEFIASQESVEFYFLMGCKVDLSALDGECTIPMNLSFSELTKWWITYMEEKKTHSLPMYFDLDNPECMTQIHAREKQKAYPEQFHLEKIYAHFVKELADLSKSFALEKSEWQPSLKKKK